MVGSVLGVPFSGGSGGGGGSTVDPIARPAALSVVHAVGTSIPHTGSTWQDGFLWHNMTGAAVAVPSPAIEANMLAAGFLKDSVLNAEVVTSAGTLSGAAPAGARLGYDLTNKRFYYVDAVGDWVLHPSSVGRPRRVTGDTTVADGEHVIVDNTALATVTIAAGATDVQVSRATTSTANVDVVSADSHTIAGDTSGTLNEPYGPVLFVFDGTSDFTASVPGQAAVAGGGSGGVVQSVDPASGLTLAGGVLSLDISALPTA